MKKKLAIGLTAAILTGICSSVFAAEPTVEEQQQEFLMGFNMEKKSTGVSNDNYYRFQVSTKF